MKRMRVLHSSQQSFRPSALSGIALSGVLVSGVAVLALHVLSPEFDPFTRAMSDYVHGRYGALLVAALWAMAVGLGALSEACRCIVTLPRERVGVWLLAGAGTCVLIASLFPIDDTPDGHFTTAIGAVHAVSSFVMSPLLVGAILCLLGSFGPSDHRRLESIDTAFGVLAVAAFVILLAINLLFHLPIGGLGQRVFMGLVSAWLTVASLRLMRR